MKSIIAMSLAGLIGLIATESHAESFSTPTVLVCKVEACVKDSGAPERCEVDSKERAIISDYGDSFLITYASETSVASPVLTVKRGQFMAGSAKMKQGKTVSFARRNDGYNFGIRIIETHTTLEFKSCYVAN